jgi:TrmH family RNA methyltransferase
MNHPELLDYKDRERFHIILVRPENNLNIGSVARAMSNLGFKHLHLVAPLEFDPGRAKITACWGENVLASVTIHKDLDSALAPLHDVVGFSARSGKNRPLQQDLVSWAAAERGSSGRNVGLVFGPESTGLEIEDSARCRKLIWIPAAAENPAFNLSQAVLLALYELSRGVSQVGATREELADWGQLQALERMVDELAELSQFYHTGTPEHVPDLLKGLFRRIQPDQRELQILLGLVGNSVKSLRRR